MSVKQNAVLDSDGREYLPQSLLIQCRNTCTAWSVFLVLHIFGRKNSVSEKAYKVHLCTSNTIFNITLYSVLLSLLGGCCFLFFIFFFTRNSKSKDWFLVLDERYDGTCTPALDFSQRFVVRKPTWFEVPFFEVMNLLLKW